jgi:DNA-binding transcriptional ArsR family regulator
MNVEGVPASRPLGPFAFIPSDRRLSAFTLSCFRRYPTIQRAPRQYVRLDRTEPRTYLAIQLDNRLVYHHMPADNLSRTFSALADPTRRAILARLASGEASVTELAEPFDMSLPAISKHLKVLERAGLIARSRDAQWRPCRLEAKPLKGAADWLERYRIFWEQSLDRLEAYLKELQGKEKRGGRRH